MSNLFGRVHAMAGASGNKPSDSCSSHFALLRETICAKPASIAPTNNARNFARPAIQSIAVLILIVISMVVMPRPAKASGIVSPTSIVYWVGDQDHQNSCMGLSSIAAIQSCQLAKYSFANHYCGARLTDYGTLNGNTNAFSITPVYGWGLWGGPLICTPSFSGTPYYYWVVAVSTCPPHASAQHAAVTCTCTDPYKPDPSGTSCILSEQYSIALHGLGGVVMPTKTRAAYAEVIKSDGTHKSGVHVDLELTVEPENGEPIRAEYVGSISPNGGSTDADGRLDFTFTAPLAGGLHTITASCTGCTNNPVSGTIKVPGCPVPPLTAPPFTDPVAAGFENGNRWRPDLLTGDYPAHLTCVENAITTAGGTYTPTSAYRPTQYQQHLYEIIKKDKKLDTDYMTAHPECQELRNKVTEERAGHGLKFKQKVAEPGTSRHESGTAFDLTPSGLTEAQLTPIYAGCSVTHTAVSGEPWHVQ